MTSHLDRSIGLMSRVFTNGPGDRSSIPGRVIPKTLKKCYLMPPCLSLSIIMKGSRVKGSNSGNRVALSLTSRCSSYWKGRLWVTNFTFYKCIILIITIKKLSMMMANFISRTWLHQDINVLKTTESKAIRKKIIKAFKIMIYRISQHMKYVIQHFFQFLIIKSVYTPR